MRTACNLTWGCLSPPELGAPWEACSWEQRLALAREARDLRPEVISLGASAQGCRGLLSRGRPWPLKGEAGVRPPTELICRASPS